MRDHRKLRAFEVADRLVIDIYRSTSSFPKHEQLGLTSQLRRAAISVPSNIVEGCSRSTQNDFVRFLEIAYGSAREVEYQLSVAHRIGYLTHNAYAGIQPIATEACKVLNGLLCSIRSS